MKTERFELKLSPEDKVLIAKAAGLKGKSIGSFLLDCTVPKAFRIVEADKK